MTANAAELQLQIDLVDIKFTSLQTQLNASLWVGWVPQIPMRNIRILQNPMHLSYYSYHESLTRDIKMWPIAMDVFSYVGHPFKLQVLFKYSQCFIRIFINILSKFVLLRLKLRILNCDFTS